MQRNSTGSAADDFVPAPAIANSAAPKTSAVEVADDRGGLSPMRIDNGIGQTALILSLVVFVVVAAILMFVRGAIRRSLIASRATLDSANAASWAWYATLLALAGLLIGGVVGHLFSLTSYVIVTVALLVVGVVVSSMLTTRARRAA